MNSRLVALVNRGYDVNEVLRLASYTDEELKFASECAFEHISRDCESVDNPSAVFIGGQPGSGKTVVSMKLKNKFENAVQIGIDNYRMYHPRYLEMEECIKRHWVNRVETENDTPGNDIADFTHLFAGAMTDELIDMAKNEKYNLLLEWGMREPNGPLNCMKMLKDNEYKNTVLFVSTPKEVSYSACKLRTGVFFKNNHIIRNVPKSFHDYSVSTLPDSIDEIYKTGYSTGIVDYMAIISRNDEILWDDRMMTNPGTVFNDYVNGNVYDSIHINDVNLAVASNFMECIGLDKKSVRR